MLARPVPLLGLVALGYLALQALLVPADMTLEWDEVVYTSQVAPGVPDAMFSAPRARGVTWLVAPIVQVTTDPVAIRWWMMILAAGGLFLAFLPWTRLLKPTALVLAAGLFATLWVALWYGPQVMPNLYVAFGAVLAIGSLLVVRESPSGWAYAGLAAGFASVAMLRPSDVLWLGVVAGPAALLWRRWAAAATILVAAVVGSVPWVVEAYTSFGSLLQRWAAAGEVQGGIAPAPGFWYEFKAANGPAFCRPCDIPLERPYLLIWWLALPALALVSARRHPVPLLAGLAMAAPYLFLVDYAAPRFLLPAYALLMIPAAATMSRFRPPFAVLLAAYLVVQFTAFQGVKGQDYPLRQFQAAFVQKMIDAGVTRPCTLVGTSVNPAHQFLTGCDVRIVRRGESVAEAAQGLPGVVATLSQKTPPKGAEEWDRHVLASSNGKPTWITMIRPNP
ncbi:hypothetical protein FDA94_06995 [Herbidospora galbida]|uniref:Glycosyltransferase family 39 protein n=1 Tax=Herbidospora galbida TaxID=2575442 RepID=A0A4U3MPF4_9ACTN|nr:hypothetical protein [Herbidospora galbida]TKK90157.1 hypothetical protein FDA94_06995 [Herbidospora galbida]